MLMDSTTRASNEPWPEPVLAAAGAGGKGDTDRSALSLVFSVGVPCGVPVLH